jgi:hypothetical protein
MLIALRIPFRNQKTLGLNTETLPGFFLGYLTRWAHYFWRGKLCPIELLGDLGLRKMRTDSRTRLRTRLQRRVIRHFFRPESSGRRVGRSAHFKTACLFLLFRMRVLLRDESRGYYADSGNWIFDRARAMDFGLIERAIQLNAERNLGATHIVLAYDSPACNLTLPISNYNSVTPGTLDRAAHPNSASTAALNTPSNAAARPAVRSFPNTQPVS